MSGEEKVEGKSPLTAIFNFFTAKAPEEPKSLFILEAKNPHKINNEQG